MRGPQIWYIRGGGSGGLTCFVLRGQKIGCHSVVSLAQPPSDHAGGGKRTSWKLEDCFLTNYLICITLCGFYSEDIRCIPTNLNDILKKYFTSPVIVRLNNVTKRTSYESCSAHFCFYRNPKFTQGVLLSSFPASDDDMAEETGASALKAPQHSSALPLTCQGT